MKNEGILDENNNYVINYLDADKVRVSFAENKLMDIEYYYDDAYTDKIESTSF